MKKSKKIVSCISVVLSVCILYTTSIFAQSPITDSDIKSNTIATTNAYLNPQLISTPPSWNENVDISLTTWAFPKSVVTGKGYTNTYFDMTNSSGQISFNFQVLGNNTGTYISVDLYNEYGNVDSCYFDASTRFGNGTFTNINSNSKYYLSISSGGTIYDVVLRVSD